MRLRALVAGVAVVASCAVLSPAAGASTRTHAPDGVLFYPSLLGVLPSLQAPHFCSASVVHSSGHDLVITAAHCVYGTGATIEFAPGFSSGRTPYGVWSVTRVYVDPGWQLGQDPGRDVAILAVAPLGGRHIEDVVGARTLAVPVVGAPAGVLGYPLDSGTPASCSGVLTLTNGYPGLTCPDGGMTDGVSGAAFVQHSDVVGVVGGPEQGGCSATTVYSAPFGAWTTHLLARAETGVAGDLVLPGFLANACL